MIIKVQGDLLASDCNIIAHQSNCLGAFGGGIARQIRTQIPEMYTVFAADTRKSEEKLGSLCYSRIKNNTAWGFNLYGQFYYGNRGPEGVDTVYAAFKQALYKMLAMAPELARISKFDTIKIGLPWLIGCGLAGGDWEKVYKIIEDASNFHKLDIYLYEFTP